MLAPFWGFGKDRKEVCLFLFFWIFVGLFCCLVCFFSFWLFGFLVFVFLFVLCLGFWKKGVTEEVKDGEGPFSDVFEELQLNGF